MSDEVDGRISPALHPLNVRQVEGFCDETASVLAATESAFRSAYEAVRMVHDARAVAARNQAWTEATVVIHTDALARKHMERVTAAFDSTRNRLMDGINGIERDLTAPVTSKASLGIAAEVRAHMKGLSTDKRTALIRHAIVSGDDVTATAVLGGPSYLSGLTDEMQGMFTRQYHEHTSPAAVLRLKAMRGAVDLIERNAPVVFREFEKAVGCPPHKAKALREANTAAEKAMVFRDVA